MPVITLTTDLAGGSYYLAALKGTILSTLADAQIIDISNHTNHFDMRQAAFTLQRAAKFFPAETIHLLHVNSSEADRRMIIAKFNEKYFLLFNNGSGPLIFGNELVEYFETEKIEEPGSLFLQTISTALKQITERKLNPIPTEKIKILRRLNPILRQGFIRGNISTIDQYGNAITNITKEMFQKYIGKNFELAVNSYRITEFSEDYNGKTKGDIVVFFNSENLLEIAMNQASAEKLLGLRVEGIFTIEDL